MGTRVTSRLSRLLEAVGAALVAVTVLRRLVGRRRNWGRWAYHPSPRLGAWLRQFCAAIGRRVAAGRVVRPSASGAMSLAWERVLGRYGVLGRGQEPDQIPWAPLRKPLSECRVALLTTVGVRLSPRSRYSGQRGDPACCPIPSSVDVSHLLVDDGDWDSADAHRDVNVVFPLERFRELAREGVVGDLADTHFSISGFHGPLAEGTVQLVERCGPQIARELVRQGVDAAFITPT